MRSADRTNTNSFWPVFAGLVTLAAMIIVVVHYATSTAATDIITAIGIVCGMVVGGLAGIHIGTAASQRTPLASQKVRDATATTLPLTQFAQPPV